MKWTKDITITNENNMTLMNRYPDNYFDLAVVDPPYGIKESSKNHESRNVLFKGKKLKGKNYTPKNWDNKIPSKKYFLELKRVSKNQIIFGANHFIENIPQANSSCWLVWDKDNGNNDFADCELAYCSFKTAVRKIKFRWHGMLQGDMKNKEVRIHPTQKPAALYRWILQKYAKQNHKILDTHLGSGSIALSCHQLGFELTACELDPEYYNDALNRFKKETQQLMLKF